MDIECKLKREGGTRAAIDKTEYHFAPRDDGAHVAFVADEAHADRFLAIPEAYKVYRGKAAAPVARKAAAPVVPVAEPKAEPEAPLVHDTLYGSSAHPASFDINGKTYSLGDVVALAHAASGLDTKEWNELEDDSRADLIDEQLDILNADTSGDGVVDNTEERAALAAKFKEKFGKAPHHKLSAEKIRAQLEA